MGKYPTNPTSITLEGNALVFTSPYEPALVAELKAQIPFTERKWDQRRKAWVVAPQHGQLLASLTAKYLNELVMVPQATAAAVEETRILEVHYLGMTKFRENFTEQVAFGYVGPMYRGEWSAIFPESVLQNWFLGISIHQEQEPAEASTLYSMLGILRQASESEVKTAYRRMARQWHPDVCHEPHAAEQFMAIKNAYEVLGDAKKRARYDAGLALEASIRNQQHLDDEFVRRISSAMGNGYRSPLRCGYVLVTGVEQVGRFLVKQIHQWEDIVDGAGRTLVTSWPAGADMFEEAWMI